MPRAHLALVPRHTFQEWTRDRLVQIHAELSALRQDLKRLKRLSTTTARCHQCRVLATITICEDGNWRCKRCLAVPKGETA